MTETDVGAVVAMDPSSRMGGEQLREELERSWSHLWVAREDLEEDASWTQAREVVGFLIAWHVANELHVLNVTTRADRRRRGIGRALIDTVLAYGRDKRVNHVLLEVRRSNDAAISLYRSVGFFATAVRPRYYPDDEDAVEMVLLLDSITGDVVAHADDVTLD